MSKFVDVATLNNKKHQPKFAQAGKKMFYRSVTQDDTQPIGQSKVSFVPPNPGYPGKLPVASARQSHRIFLFPWVPGTVLYSLQSDGICKGM